LEFHSLCGVDWLTDELLKGDSKVGVQGQVDEPSKMPVKLVDDGENGHERSRTGGQKYTDGVSRKDLWATEIATRKYCVE